jgi:thiamine biosynthesis lipoprotein
MPTFEALPCEAGEGWVGAAHAQEHRLRKNNPETRLDLGGIAKGYAVDCAVEALQARGIQQGWVNAGGDLRVWGGWDFPIHIRHRADASKATPLLALKDGAFATSVLPLSDGGSIHVSVAAPRCLWADALTKVVAYAPPALSQQLLARYDARPFIHPF